MYHIDGMCIIGRNLNHFPDDEKRNTSDKRKKAAIIKQEILIYSSRITRSKQVSAIMRNSEISASFVYSLHEAMVRLVSTPPAFLWLDVDREDAEALLREIADWTLRPPYIILTSSFINSQDRAIMLNRVADTCIEIPADPVEIISVINAVLRRGEQANGAFTNLLPCITYKELSINPWNREVRMRDQVVALTHTEYEILYMLASSPGVTSRRKEIYANIWREESDIGATVVTNHMSVLRQKLGLLPSDKEYIETIYKVVYRFVKYK